MLKFFIFFYLILISTVNFAENSEEIRFKKHKKIFFITGLGKDNSPAWWGDSKHNQVKFQISFKYRTLGDIYFGFTQLSVWDIWDVPRSSPFEESNYNPEIFYVFDIDKTHSITTGFEHISNGQSKESGNSRSINRPYIIFQSKWFSFFEQKIKLWFYFDDIIDALDLIDDSLLENKDISKYLGYGEIWFNFFLSENFNIEIMLRKGASTKLKKGAIQIGIDFRVPIPFLLKYEINPTFYIEWFAGYGETLLQYNYGEIQYRFGGMLSF